MEYKTIIYQKEGNIARIMFNRPEKLNAWDFPGMGGMVDDFHAALSEAEEDDDVKVVILKGAGRAFTSGHDFNTVWSIYGGGTGKPGERRHSQRIRLKVDRAHFDEHFRRVFLFPKVTIAQVHGYCLGEGATLCELCDLAIAAEDAKIGWVEQKLAIGGVGLLALTVHAIGLKNMMELMLTGKTVDGKEAARIGLVNKAVPPDKLEEEVERLARVVCLQSRDGIAIGKAYRQLAYDSLGITAGFAQNYVFHTLTTNIRWEPDEFNLLRARKERGVKGAIKAEADYWATTK